MFEDGSTADAEALIAGWLPIYDRAGLLHGHISWHQALLALEQGDAARALAIYADRVQPSVSSSPADHRRKRRRFAALALPPSGHPVPKQFWDDAGPTPSARFRLRRCFADVHVALAEAASRQSGRLEKRIGDPRRGSVPAGSAAGPVVPTVCRAARALLTAIMRTARQFWSWQPPTLSASAAAMPSAR